MGDEPNALCIRDIFEPIFAYLIQMLWVRLRLVPYKPCKLGTLIPYLREWWGYGVCPDGLLDFLNLQAVNFKYKQ